MLCPGQRPSSAGEGRGPDAAPCPLPPAFLPQLYRKRGQYLADIHWFYRKPDVPSSAVPRRAMLSDDPRQARWGKGGACWASPAGRRLRACAQPHRRQHHRPAPASPCSPLPARTRAQPPPAASPAHPLPLPLPTLCRCPCPPSAAAPAQPAPPACPPHPTPHLYCPQLLYTNDPHNIDAKFIRHPAHAWFLAGGDPEPAMRCGQGQYRHAPGALPPAPTRTGPPSCSADRRLPGWPAPWPPPFTAPPCPCLPPGPPPPTPFPLPPILPLPPAPPPPSPPQAHAAPPRHPGPPGVRQAAGPSIRCGRPRSGKGQPTVCTRGKRGRRRGSSGDAPRGGCAARGQWWLEGRRRQDVARRRLHASRPCVRQSVDAILRSCPALPCPALHWCVCRWSGC